MKKRMELLVRLVDGGQLYWDASVTVETLTEEEVEALLPKRTGDALTPEDRKQLHELVRAKFRDAADQLYERVLQRIR